MKSKEEFWKPLENESIEGVLVEVNENAGKYDDTLYKIRSDDKTYCVWESVELKELFDNVDVDDRIYLKYVGITKRGEYYKNIYELEIL